MELVNTKVICSICKDKEPEKSQCVACNGTGQKPIRYGTAFGDCYDGCD